MSAPLRAVIVDDERLARVALASLATSTGRVDVVAAVGTLAEAVEALRTHAPDVVFLDIQLRHEHGFSLLDEVPPSCAIIFVTAHEHFAARAFDTTAIDYLLKPVAKDRLERALVRVATRRGLPAATADAERFVLDDRVLAHAGDEAFLIPVSAIVAVTADGDHSTIYHRDGAAMRTVRLRRSLNDWERRLPQPAFFRVNRGAIVAVSAIARIDPWSHASYQLHLRGIADPIPVSRRRAVQLRETLS